MQITLILLKPDCITRRKVGEVTKRFEDANFQICGCKMFMGTPALLREHYAHVADRSFYPGLEAFMQSSPLIALALAGDNAVDRARAMIGPTDSRKAEKGTIRGDLGLDAMVNVLHASDSPETAQVELARFFAPGELFQYSMTYTTTPAS